MNPDTPLGRLLAVPARPGVVTWIGLRPQRRAAMVPVDRAWLDPAAGLAGDHYRSTVRRVRQLTLIGCEQIAAIASHLGRDQLHPALLRRNVVVRGINLHALRGARFRLGEAVLHATGDCHPCSRMEEILGSGGYNAVRGHGGITAQIILGGTMQIGDAILRLDDAVAS